MPGIVSYVVVSIHQGMETEVNLMRKMSLNTAMFVYWVLWVLVFSVVMCSLYYGFVGHPYHKWIILIPAIIMTLSILVVGHWVIERYGWEPFDHSSKSRRGRWRGLDVQILASDLGKPLIKTVPM